MQLIQPNEANRQHQEPRQTDHATSPPSGKSAGDIPGTLGGAAAAGGAASTSLFFSFGVEESKAGISSTLFFAELEDES